MWDAAYCKEMLLCIKTCSVATFHIYRMYLYKLLSVLLVFLSWPWIDIQDHRDYMNFSLVESLLGHICYNFVNAVPKSVALTFKVMQSPHQWCQSVPLVPFLSLSMCYNWTQLGLPCHAIPCLMAWWGVACNYVMHNTRRNLNIKGQRLRSHNR